jgi:ribosomal protein S18 acetylase RimI-like enzyme
MADTGVADETAANRPDGVRIRSLRRTDLDAVIAIDQALSGRSRRGFFTRRLDHATRHPAAFAGFAAERDAGLVGFVLARIEEGAFGSTAPEASLDGIGVDPAFGTRHGVGRMLLAHLATRLRTRGIGALETQVDWTNHRLVGFFSRTGFVPAPRIVLERDTGAAVTTGADETADDESAAQSPDRLRVRSMQRNDLPAIVAIDGRITGQDRRAYYARKLDEVFDDAGVRMSLVAEVDGHTAGFVMARVDFGEFGHTESEAVMDTIGVDPRHAHEGIATALLSQLTANLGALRVESLRTEVTWNRFALLRFLDQAGFRPHRRLALRLGLN